MSLASLESSDVVVSVVILILAFAMDAIVDELSFIAVAIGPHHSALPTHVTIFELARVNGTSLLPHSRPFPVGSEARGLTQVFRPIRKSEELLVTVTWSLIHCS